MRIIELVFEMIGWIFWGRVANVGDVWGIGWRE
jgi:hypothetical protein